MRAEQRFFARRKLDQETKPFRAAARAHTIDTPLRAVRQALGIRAVDLAQELGVNRSVLFRLEQSDKKGTISLKALERVAQAMGCTVVYSIVPRGGETLEELAASRRWQEKMGIELMVAIAKAGLSD